MVSWEKNYSKNSSLLHAGRLELCGGAWVMTDEATPHFHATIDNMVEGQQYIYQLLNVTPSTSWWAYCIYMT